MTSIATMLSRVDLFSSLSEDMRYELVQRGSEWRHPAGQVMVRQGDPTTGFHLLLDGDADVTVHGTATRTLAVGDYFGEISVIDGSPRSATVTAGDAGCRTFAISPLSFWETIEANPEMARILMKALTARLRAVEQSALGGTGD